MGNISSAMMTEEEKAEERKRELERSRKFMESKKGQKRMKSRSMKRFIEKRDERLAQGVAIRKEQEDITRNGERVWFSRHVENGCLRHWALLAHGTKYELSRSDADEEVRGKFSFPKFTYSSTPCTIDQEKAEALTANLMIPEQDGHYVCLIGWTRQSKESVNAICQDTFQRFHRNLLTWSNCQQFLRTVSDKILLVTHAADYPWFMNNIHTKYYKDIMLQPPPIEVLMRMSEAAATLPVMTAVAAPDTAPPPDTPNPTQKDTQMQAQIAGQLHVQQANQAQIQMQNQILMQQQTQLQIQIQNQIQSQISAQIANQTAMQASGMSGAIAGANAGAMGGGGGGC